MGDPLVTAITMTFNQRGKVLALLGDLGGQEYPADRLRAVVLDDGGTDGTHEAVSAWAETAAFEVTSIRRERDKPYQSALRWNECIAAAEGYDVIVQVDDVRLRPDFIARHAAWHRGAPTLVTGAKFEGDVMTWEPSSCRRAHLAGADGEARPVPWTACFGASLSYDRRVIEALSTSPHERPFDQRMVGWGFHEVEFAGRAAALGIPTVYDPKVGVFHRNHSRANDAGRGIDHARERDAGMHRNIDYVLAKHRLPALPRW